MRDKELQLLSMNLKQGSMQLDKMEFEQRGNKYEFELKARENMLQKMQDQILIRDQLLAGVGKTLEENQVEAEISHPKLVELHDLTKNASFLPPISGGVSPFVQMRREKYRGAEKKAATNSSLPSLAQQRDISESRIPKTKYLFSSNQKTLANSGMCNKINFCRR